MDLPDPATKEGAIIQNLWQGSWIAAWAVGVVTWGLMIWAVVAYRRRHKRRRSRSRRSTTCRSRSCTRSCR